MIAELSEGEGDELEEVIGQYGNEDVGIPTIGALMSDRAQAEVALDRKSVV